jgi:membrane protein implicated in regulation of membrane protease activity
VSTIFWVCAILGGGFILLQSLLGVLGAGEHELDAHADAHPDVHAGEALDLFSVRSICAGLCFFGLSGLAAREWGAPAPLALVAALIAGVVAAGGVALAMRAMKRMESDGTVRPEGAVGRPATVYLSIPGQPGTPGKVHLFLQGRTVEMKAVAREPIPTGAPVVVVDVVSPDTLEVAPQPLLGALPDAL